jgi:hypothetical protein
VNRQLTVRRIILIAAICFGTTMATSCETTYLESTRKMTNQRSSTSENGDHSVQHVLPVMPRSAVSTPSQP